MRRGPNGTHHRTLSVATSDYVAGRSVGYENQAYCRLTSHQQPVAIQSHDHARPVFVQQTPELNTDLLNCQAQEKLICFSHVNNAFHFL